MRQKVYFITAQPHLVKIGIAVHPTGRLHQLQTGSPHELRLWGSMTGGAWLEQKLHRMFHQEHYALEWFYLSPRIWWYAFTHGVTMPPPVFFWVLWLLKGALFYG